MDRELIAIGAAISAISLCFVYGASHLVRAASRHRDQDNVN
jgi:hypothetical protein